VVDGVEGWDQGRGRTVHFIDWTDPADNRFRVINQFRVDEPGGQAKAFITPILVLVDEAHRSHASALHANLLRALPNCVRIGFTGTPIIMGARKRTHAIFGELIDRYTIGQSEADGSTVPILYEGRTTEGAVRGGGRLDALFEDLLAERTPQELEAFQRKYATKGHVMEAPALIAAKARDMLRPYVENVLPNGFKAQVVAVSRRGTLRYREAFEAARDELVAALEALEPALAGLPESALADFVREKRFWMYTRLSQKEGLRQPVRAKELVSGEGFPYLGKSYRLLLVDAQDRPPKLEAGRFRLLKSEAERGRAQFVAWYVEHARPWLGQRTRMWAARLEVDPGGVEVRDLGSHWGSCGKAGVLYFHWATILLPPSIVDYVVHELAHLREPSHTPDFWRRVERALPDYERRKRWLAVHGGGHLVL